MAINIEKQIEYWKTGADSDLETAEILIQNKKFVQGLFFCHLCIEKITKAILVKETSQIPPKSHDIFYLANKAQIDLPDEKQKIVQILMKYQLEGRYPEYYPKPPSLELTMNYLKETQNLLKWLKMKL
jgi:HEPN domain-containing protein